MNDVNLNKKSIKRIPPIITFFVIILIPTLYFCLKWIPPIQVGKNTVEIYLFDTYGEENAKEMKVKFSTIGSGIDDSLTSQYYLEYQVQTPLLEQAFYIKVPYSGNAIQQDDFTKRFKEEKNLKIEYDNVVAKIMSDLPENVTYYGYITVKDLKGIRKEDTTEELLMHCTYNFQHFDIWVDEMKQEEIIDMMKYLYLKYEDYLLQWDAGYNLFYIETDYNDQDIVSLCYVKRENENEIEVSGRLPIIESGEIQYIWYEEIFQYKQGEVPVMPTM